MQDLRTYAETSAETCRVEAERLLKRLRQFDPWNWLTIGAGSAFAFVGGALVLALQGEDNFGLAGALAAAGVERDAVQIVAGVLAVIGGLLAFLHKALRCDEFQGNLKTTIAQNRALAVRYGRAGIADNEAEMRASLAIADALRQEVEAGRRVFS